MEEKQKNENKQPEFKSKMGIVWLTGILVIVLGCVTVYTFKLFNENKKIKQVPQVQTQSIQPAVTTDSTKAEETAKIENTNKTQIMTADEKFSVYANGMKKVFKNLKNDGIKYIEAFDEKVDTSEYVGTYALSSEYFAKIDNQRNLYIKDKKVTSDVLNITKMLHAQDGYYFFVIKSDGTLEYIAENDYKKSKYVSHKLEGFKNIIDVIEIQGMDYNKFLAIDIDGNSYEVNLWK